MNTVNSLVTGGAGFIGSHVAKHCLESGHQVVVLDDLSGGFRDHVPQPEDPYGISKYAVELDLNAAHHMFGLDYIIFRPHNVYGENQNIGDKYRNVIGIFMNQIMQGKPLTVFGDGNQTRAFSYIDDV